jgi:hypothetical protein
MEDTVSTPTGPPPDRKAAMRRRFEEITEHPDLADLHRRGESRWSRFAFSRWTSAAVIALLVGVAAVLAYTYL